MPTWSQSSSGHRPMLTCVAFNTSWCRDTPCQEKFECQSFGISQISKNRLIQKPSSLEENNHTEICCISFYITITNVGMYSPHKFEHCFPHGTTPITCLPASGRPDTSDGKGGLGHARHDVRSAWPSLAASWKGLVRGTEGTQWMGSITTKLKWWSGGSKWQSRRIFTQTWSIPELPPCRSKIPWLHSNMCKHPRSGMWTKVAKVIPPISWETYGLIKNLIFFWIPNLGPCTCWLKWTKFLAYTECFTCVPC